MGADAVNRIIHTHIGKDGKQEAAANLRPSGHGECNDIPYDPRPVVPVLFLHGIMGGVLRNTKLDRIVWDAGDSLFMLHYLVMTGKTRQRWLDPNNTEVCNEGGITPGLLSQTQESRDSADPKNMNRSQRKAVEEMLRERNWGTVISSAYHEFMALLHWKNRRFWM